MARYWHTAWTPTSLPDSIVLLGGTANAGPGPGPDVGPELTAEIVPGVKLEKGNILILLHIYTGGSNFQLEHSGYRACGIPEAAGDTIVLTGGRNPGRYAHNYVTRWVDGKIIIIIM